MEVGRRIHFDLRKLCFQRNLYLKLRYRDVDVQSRQFQQIIEIFKRFKEVFVCVTLNGKSLAKKLNEISRERERVCVMKTDKLCHCNHTNCIYLIYDIKRPEIQPFVTLDAQNKRPVVQ